MTSLLRWVRLLAMVVWVGGLIFFAFCLAPTAFHVLPVRQAGLVVGGVLKVFHPVALGCGLLFLLATGGLLLRSAVTAAVLGRIQIGLVTLMLLATVFLQRSVLPSMDRDELRAGGDVNAASLDDPARAHFDRLHHLSEQVEGAVLIGGLIVVGLLASEKS